MNDNHRDFRNWNDLTCPHCKAEQPVDDWFWQEPWDTNDERAQDCTECGETYTIETSVTTPDFRTFAEEEE